MDKKLITAAETEARRVASGRYGNPAPNGMRREKWWVMGDPQASLRRVLSSLAAEGLLGEDGRLLPEVGLVSMGDHFDYHLEPGMTLLEAAEQGHALLSWLAAHPPDQVTLLGGNHDFVRVMELAPLSNVSWHEAQVLAEQVNGGGAPEVSFRERFPSIPTSEIVRRDFNSFTVAQRDLVQALLMAGRLHLAAIGVLADGTPPALLTHAGMTTRELGLLGMEAGEGAEAIAERLNSFLADAVARVAPRWARGEPVPLSLHPLVVAGISGQEAGGFLHHRASIPGAERIRPGEEAWYASTEYPRRFDPRTALPRGLVQIVGHEGHDKCRRKLVPWVDSAADVPFAAVRTLTVTVRGEGSYRLGIHEPNPGEATVYFVDPSFASAPQVEQQWLALKSVRV